MPAFTFLSEHEMAAFQTVPDDPECNELLQQLRTLTGENWLVGIWTVTAPPTLWQRIVGTGRRRRTVRYYTLYADCHGEWQVINCVTPEGGSVFHPWPHSRVAVMNYMLGVMAGVKGERWRSANLKRRRVVRHGKQQEE